MARRASQAPPSRPSSKCFRTCHPPPLHYLLSTWTWGTREDRRAELGRKTGNRPPRRARVPQSHAPKLAPASRAAIVPAQPPPVARPPRARAPTPGRGSRLRRWRHNNINTAGPLADPAARRLPHSPGSAANDDRTAHRQTPAPSGRWPQPLASVARVSAPRDALSGLGRSAE